MIVKSFVYSPNILLPAKQGDDILVFAVGASPTFELQLVCEPVSETALLGRIAAGDVDAFWEMWSAHRDWLFRICCHQMNRREDAEDVLGEIRERMADTLPRDSPHIQNLPAWLRRVAMNACADAHRQRRRRLALVAEGEDLTVTASPDPARLLLASEAGRIAKQAVESLPTRLRRASRMFFLQDATYPAIAAELSITEPNARKRIQDARVLLRQRLSSLGYASHWPHDPRGEAQKQTTERIRSSPHTLRQRNSLKSAFGESVQLCEE